MPKDLDLSIDKTDLATEWVNQPTLYFEWAKYAADCQADLDRAKSRLELAKAEVEQSIRDAPSDYGIVKATDKSVEATVLTQPEYRAALKAVNTAKHDLAVANAAVQALEHRKRSLTLLVELWIREYYTSDASPRPRSSEAAQFDKNAVRGRGRRRVETKRERANEEDTDDE